MSEPLTVRVSSRYQISVPSDVRQRLNIHSGDQLLVDVQGGLLILVPKPRDYTGHLAGLHREIWEGVDTAAYLQEERDAWDTSPTD